MLDKFQSTHPLRGATISQHSLPESSTFQSTHPLRGATISRSVMVLLSPLFQSTHPLRGATDVLDRLTTLEVISIHAPLAGCDSAYSGLCRRSSYFNPRTPCGVRRHRRLYGAAAAAYFNPRTPCGVRRRKLLIFCKGNNFNPRTPCGVRRRPKIPIAPPINFNPRTPCGVRQRKCTKFSAHFAITDNSIGFPRPECRLLGHFLLIPGACSARERVRTFL